MLIQVVIFILIVVSGLLGLLSNPSSFAFFLGLLTLGGVLTLVVLFYVFGLDLVPIIPT